MEHRYRIHFGGESLELINLVTEHRTEIGLIHELTRSPSIPRLHLAELIVSWLFEKFDSANHTSENWSENLKTLLAHGFEILNSANGQKLKKSFFPITFELYANLAQRKIHFGHFHRKHQQNAVEQFIRFCRATEYPPGIHEHVITSVLDNGGGRLIAIEPSRSTLLIQRDPATGTITGSDEIFSLLSEPVILRAG